MIPIHLQVKHTVDFMRLHCGSHNGISFSERLVKLAWCIQSWIHLAFWSFDGVCIYTRTQFRIVEFQMFPVLFSNASTIFMENYKIHTRNNYTNSSSSKWNGKEMKWTKRTPRSELRWGENERTETLNMRVWRKWAKRKISPALSLSSSDSARANQQIVRNVDITCTELNI